MADTFMTELCILKVRHLWDVSIPISQTERKSLILTGKNGSGKTSILEALREFLKSLCSLFLQDTGDRYWLEQLSRGDYAHLGAALIPVFADYYGLRRKCEQGTFILAYYGDSREMNLEVPRNIQRITPKASYSLDDHPGKDLVKYLVNLKTTQAFALTSGNQARAREIQSWFDRFLEVLRDIYESPSLELKFDIETFAFTIEMDGREPFDFNTMSMGYAAVFDIISDLMMRMEGKRRYDLEGLVLIDEIETHLHVDLQKKIMPVLMKLFPNIQFVVTTHSPFVLNSTPNAVIYDLENHTLVKDGLTNLPYEGVVEGYFGAERMSQELKEKFQRYQVLSKQAILTDQEWVELDGLELYLDEVPDFLALDFATEYGRLRLENANRG